MATDISPPQRVVGLGRRLATQAAGTYNATEILGYRVVNAGTAGSWIATGIDGGTGTVAFGDQQLGVVPEHLSSLVVPTNGIAILYLPTPET